MKTHSPKTHFLKNQAWWFVVIVALMLCVVLAEFAWRAYHAETVAQEDPELLERTVVEYVVDEVSDTVSYTYLGEKLPPKLAESEVVKLRTENSFTKEIARTDEEVTLEAIFYPQESFVKTSAGEWRYSEHATTTKDALLKTSFFRNARYTLARVVMPVVYAITDTIYAPTADGYVAQFNVANWATAQGASTGNTVSQSSTDAWVYVRGSSEGGSWQVFRVFVPFDTSSLPSNAAISSATLNMYLGINKYQADDDGNDFIVTIRTDNSSYTTLTTADFNNTGATTNPTEGSGRVDVTGMATNAYIPFTLNATGIGWIAKSGQASNCSASTGISCFGLREGHDALNSSPADGFTGVGFVSADTSGTSNDPYLSVTYTVAASHAFWMFNPF